MPSKASIGSLLAGKGQRPGITPGGDVVVETVDEEERGGFVPSPAPKRLRDEGWKRDNKGSNRRPHKTDPTEATKPPQAAKQERGGRIPMMTTTTEKRKPSAYKVAEVAAKQITCPNPEEAQPKEYEVLVAAVEALANQDAASMAPEKKREQRKLCYSLSKSCLLETIRNGRRTPAFSLYAAARLARMAGIASGTVAIRNAIVVEVEPQKFEQVLELQDLVKCGLMTYETWQTQAGEFVATEVFHVGHEALARAEVVLRQNEKTVSADVLSKHLKQGDINRGRIEAAREAEAKAKAAAEAS